MNDYFTDLDGLELSNLKSWKAYKNAMGEQIPRGSKDRLIELLEKQVETLGKHNTDDNASS